MYGQTRKSKSRKTAALTAAAVIGGSAAIMYGWNAASDYIESYRAPMNQKDALAKLDQVRAEFKPEQYSGARVSTGAPFADCINVNFTDGTRAVVYNGDKLAAVAPVTRRFDQCSAEMQKQGEEFRKNPADLRLLNVSAVQYSTEAAAKEATEIFQRHAENVVQQAFRNNPSARISVAITESATASVMPFNRLQTQPDPDPVQAVNVRQSPGQSNGTHDVFSLIFNNLEQNGVPYIFGAVFLFAAVDSWRTKRRQSHDAMNGVGHLGLHESLERPATRKLPAASTPSDNVPR